MAIYNLGTASGKIEINSSDVNTAAANLTQAGRGLVGFGAAALGAFGYTIKVAADFEKQMDFVRAVTGSTVEEIDALTQAAIELGKRGPFGPREVAEGFVDLAKAGLLADDIINGVGEASVNLAAAGDIPLTQSAETLVNVLQTFKLSAEDAVAVVDTLAGAANASTIDIDDLALSMTYAGAPAAALGVSVDDLSTAIAILGNRGIDGSVAGTSLRRSFLQLAAPTRQASAEMKKLGLITEDGTNKLFDATGKLRPLGEVFQEIQDATKGLNNQDLLASLNAIFGARAVNAAAILTGVGEAGFQDVFDQIQNVSAEDVAAERLDNLSGALTRLKAAVDSVLIGAGSPFQDGLKDLVNIVRDVVIWFGNLPPGLQKFIVFSLAAVGVLSVLSGGFLLTIGTIARAVNAFAQIGTAMSTVTSLVGAATRAFTTLGAALLANPVFLVIAAIVALGVAFYLLYTRVEGFRNFIDNTWQEIQKGWDSFLNFMRAVPGALGGIFESIGNVITGVIDYIGDRIRGVQLGIDAFFAAFNGEGITTGADKIVGQFERMGVRLRSLVDGVIAFRNTVVAFFRNLPGAVVNGLEAALDAVIRFAGRAPRYMGYVTGLILGSVLRMSYEVPRYFRDMAFRSLRAVFSFGTNLAKTMFRIGLNLIRTVVSFLLRLPGIFARFLLSALKSVIDFGPQLVGEGFSLGFGFLQSIADFLGQLPGEMIRALEGMINALFNFVGGILTAAQEIGRAIFDGIAGFITGLPDLIIRIGQLIIQALRDGVGGVFNAARDFGSGLWDGFRKGMGINSPSYIEEALFAIQEEAKYSAGYLANQVRQLNGIARSIPSISSPSLMTPSANPTTFGAASTGMVDTYNQNAPLIGQATIRDERDALTMARELDRLRKKQNRARGIKIGVLA